VRPPEPWVRLARSRVQLPAAPVVAAGATSKTGRRQASVSVRRLRWIAQENSKIRRAVSAG
jgi:hypothetical protein